MFLTRQEDRQIHAHWNFDGRKGNSETFVAWKPGGKEPVSSSCIRLCHYPRAEKGQIVVVIGVKLRGAM